MLTKEESKMLHGIAILAMVALHLFCRIENLPYNVHLFDKGGRPILYYFGLFGDICVPIYCFTSGYAQQLLSNVEGRSYRVDRWKRLWKFISHYWLILILFCVIGFFIHDADMPGGLSKFFGNLLLYNLSYNGAWWFILTYCFLIAVAPLIIMLVENVNPWILFFCSGVIYVLSYIFYFNYEISFEIAAVDWCWEQLLLFGRSLFSFTIGAMFCHFRTFGKLQELFAKNWMRRGVCLAAPILLFSFHTKVQSLIVAPIIAIGCMCCFFFWEKPDWVKRAFTFFGKHSTNIWLTHMFFYLFLFKGFIFRLKEPVLIYAGMLSICILVSYGVMYIERMGEIVVKRSVQNMRIV